MVKGRVAGRRAPLRRFPLPAGPQHGRKGPLVAQALAVDLAPIRVNTIQPGLIDTPFLDTLGDRRSALIAEYSERLPVGRVGRAEEVADAVLFLMKNGFVTGITLTIDGGGVLT